MNHRPPRLPEPKWLATVALALGLLPWASASAAVPAELARGYAEQAGRAPMPDSGQQFFTRNHGREWACASCHGAVPVQAGKHASTGRPIGALAPAFNPNRFTDPAKVEKWFRRNCHDVLGRECTAAEKADVVGWLTTLKP